MPGVAPAEAPSQLAPPEPGYAIAYRIDQRAAQTQPPPEVMRLPAPLNELPWEFAKDQFGAQRADFIGSMGALLVEPRKTSSGRI